MFAVATLLYDARYLPGALVLGHVLRKFELEKTRLVILIDMTAFTHSQLTLLRELWDELIDTRVSELALTQKLNNDLKRPELAKTYTKTELWNLPFEKVLYLDADVLPLNGENHVTRLLQLDFPKGKILAAPDSGFPDIFNSGVFVLAPNTQDYENLAQIVASNSTNVSFDGADQGLLNQYFNADPDWVSRLIQAGINDATLQSRIQIQNSNWIPIPFLYNTTPNAQYQYYPALSHFGYPELSAAPTGGNNQQELGDSTVNSENTSLGVSLGVSLMVSLNYSPYGDIPLSHFSTSKATSHVSVLHFIGAAKPWNHEHSPVFQQWWQQWYEYSKGRLIDAVLGRQAFPISVHELKHPSAITFLSGQAPSVNSPAQLCDPMNYQHIKSAVVPDSKFWDATKEAPPREPPKTANSKAHKKNFSQDWEFFSGGENRDGNEKDVGVRNGISTGKSSSFVPESPRVHDKNTDRNLHDTRRNVPHGEGVHEDQVPERVFDESSDYRPRHLLMMTDRDSLIQAEERKVKNTSQTIPGTVADIPGPVGGPVAGVLQKLAKIDISQETPTSKLSEETAQKSPEADAGPSLPKIFPWEYKDFRPERVWD